MSNQLKVVFLDALKNKGVEEKDEGDDIDLDDFDITDTEQRLVEDFLLKFTIISESSMNEHLDILLMLKALPNKVMDSNI
jgi:hypothetical protein